MIQNVIIGQYLPGQSVIHRMDPRAKLIFVFLFVLIIFLANNMYTYGLVGLFTIGAVVISQIPLSYIYRGLKPVLWIILFTMILHVFTSKTGELLFEFGWIKIYSEGVIQGILISLRLLFLIMMTSLLTLTTTPIEITDGMEAVLSPFKRFGLPVHELSLMMSISLRFIPTLMQETEKIIKAQTARGIEFSSGPIKERFGAIIPLLVPLFVGAFKRAEELALAMEARGYRGGIGRTKLRELKWHAVDTVGLILLVLLAVALILFRS